MSTSTKEEGGPFSSNPCILQQPYVMLDFTCVQADSIEHSKLITNILERRAGEEERRSYPEVSVGIQMEEEEFQDFPEKKAAAWHSRP